MLTRECQNFHEAESDLPLPKRVKPNYSDTSLLCTIVDMMADEEDLELQYDTFGISSYLQEPNLPIYTATSSSSDPSKVNQERNNPLQYWKNNEKSKITLSRLARKYLCAPAGSVPSERLFSTAALIADDRRNRLLPEKVEMLLFLKKNLPLINYDY